VLDQPSRFARPARIFLCASLPLALALGACEGSPSGGADGGARPPDAAAADAGSPGTDGGTPPGTDGGPVSSCPQADDFLDVTGTSAGAGYPAPSLDAHCEGDLLIVDSNGIPNFTFVAITPNALAAQDYAWEIPLRPAPASVNADVPLVGPSGIAVNGLPIYGPTEAPAMGSRDPFLDGILDYCNGHTAPGGVYHFHAPPECLFTDYEGQTHLVVGYAFDGYPILAPFECTDEGCTATRELRSSYRQLEASYGTTIANAWDAHEYVEGLGDLDACNGRELPGGGYAYYATRTFPYFIGCYHGTPRAQPTGGGGMTGGGGGMTLPMCPPGQTSMCCGDGVCDGPETATTCAADCA
jgi:hypothetical protein